MSWLYGIQSGLFIKVGVAGDLARRMKQMNLYNPHPCKVIMRRRLHGDAYTVERRLHQVLAPYAIGREWFAADPALVKAAATLVARQVREERIAWQIECARKPRRKSSMLARFGGIVDCDADGNKHVDKSNA